MKYILYCNNRVLKEFEAPTDREATDTVCVTILADVQRFMNGHILVVASFLDMMFAGIDSLAAKALQNPEGGHDIQVPILWPVYTLQRATGEKVDPNWKGVFGGTL